jgi:putative oxidoreductase
MNPGMDLGTLLHGTNPMFTDVALLIGRVAIGVCFMIHAFGKLGWVGSGSMEGFARWLGDLGVPMPEVQARMAMLSELVGGAMLALGLGTRPACVALIGTMLVAGIVGHRGAGYLITNNPPGAEYTINLAVICLMFLLIGPGAISLDAMLF